MKRIPRHAALLGLLAAGTAALLPACGGDGDSTGTGGTGGTTTTATGGGGAGAQGGDGGEAGMGGQGGDGGAGGTAGNGGGGSPPTGKPDGDPCATNEECANGFCLTQAQFGWPYGACSGACNTFVECTAGSTCGEVANNPFCLKLCATNDDCKQGKLCTDIGDETACLPYCTTDDECAPFGSCNEGTGQCTPAEDCEMPGDEDDNALSDCEDGDCVGTAACQPVIADACGAAPVLPIVPGEPLTVMGDTTGQESLFGGYCAGGGSGEDLAEITVPNGFTGMLEVTLVSQSGDLAIYVRDTCENDLSSQCRDDVTEGDAPEILRRSITGPKTVWAFVDGSTYGSPKEGAYSMTTTLLEAQPETEPNDDAASADVVSTDAVASLVTGDLDQATDDDDWFFLDTTLLAGNKTLTLETTGNAGSGCAPVQGDIDTFLEVLAEDGTTVLGDDEDIDFAENWCSLVSLPDMPPAKYLVHVKTSSFCLPDPMGPDCAFPYGIKILIQ